jgi:hypothetical protein
VARAETLGLELDTPITPGFEDLVLRRILHEKGALVSLAAKRWEAMDWLLAHP